jgi:ACR3 family arsenite transporter
MMSAVDKLLPKCIILFTTAGNNFELGIAYLDLTADRLFAAVVGPAIEVPELIVFVNVAFWLKRKYYKSAVAVDTSSL